MAANPLHCLPGAAPGEIEAGATCFQPKFDADGLIPAIVTDAATGEVLMFARMNAEALAPDVARRSSATSGAGRATSSGRRAEESGATCCVSPKCAHRLRSGRRCGSEVTVEGDGGACHQGAPASLHAARRAGFSDMRMQRWSRQPPRALKLVPCDPLASRTLPQGCGCIPRTCAWHASQPAVNACVAVIIPRRWGLRQEARISGPLLDARQLSFGRTDEVGSEQHRSAGARGGMRLAAGLHIVCAARAEQAGIHPDVVSRHLHRRGGRRYATSPAN